MRRGLLLLLVVIATLGLGAGSRADAASFPQRLPDMASSAVKLTVSGGSTNETGANNLYAPVAWVKVYSPTKADRNLTYRTEGECGGVKQLVAYKTTADEQVAATRTDGRDLLNGCGNFTFKIPASLFTKSTVTGHWVNSKDPDTGYYVALVRIQLVRSTSDFATVRPSGSGPRSTFTISANASSVGIGYWGLYEQGKPSSVTDPTPLDTEADKLNVTGFLAQPLTSSQKDTYELQFSPPCDSSFWGSSSPNASRRIWLKWFDDDYGAGYQPTDLRIQVFEARQGSSGIGTSVLNQSGKPPFTGGGNSGRAQLTVKRGYKYTWKWYNVTRANGIAIYLPFDSGNFDFRCPMDTWTLDNSTTRNPGIGTFANTGSATQKQQQAREAFQAARFTHTVTNLDSSDDTAKDGFHHSVIEYRVKRGNSDTWQAWKDKSPERSRDLRPGQSFAVRDSQGDSPTLPRTAHLSYLITNHTPVAKGAKCSNNPRGTNPGKNNCAWNGSMWAWTEGDKYCERVRTGNAYKMNEGATTNGPIYSNTKCLELGAPSPPECPDWRVQGVAYPLSGPRDPGGAWVGDSFTAAYGFWHTGRAETTAPIHFWHNSDQQPDQVLGRYDPSFTIGPFGPQHGGQTFTDQMTYRPTTGNTDCSQTGDGIQGPQSVYVPYYYHLTGAIQAGGATMMQGDPIDVDATVSLPDLDIHSEVPGDHEFGGRGHTFSQATNWRIVSFKTSDRTAARAAIGNHKEGNGGPCADLAAGVPDFTACNDAASGGSEVFAIGRNKRPDGSTMSLGYHRNGTIDDPVGTVYCFVLAINRPTHHASPAWRYSQAACRTVVKSPKVQFRNGDVTVGRPIDRGGGGPSCTPVPNASIRATPAPRVGALGVVSPAYQHLYGSWVEYGAFATGRVTGFGSSGEEMNNSSEASRLTFTNEQPTQLGRYQYASQCLANHFATVNADDPTQVTDITAEADNLQLTTSPRIQNPANDKRGYVSTKSVQINPLPTDSYTARVTVTAAGDWGNDRPDAELHPAKMAISVSSGSTYQTRTIDVTAAYPSSGTYTADIDLGVNGWQGLKNTATGQPAVSIQFVNNNHNSFWDTIGPPRMTDRNLYLGQVTVQWLKNGSQVASMGPVNALDLPKDGNDYYTGAPNPPCPDRTRSNNNGLLGVPSSKGDNGYAGGYCHGIHLNQSQLGFPPGTPPAASLNDAYDGFRGRNIVLYAKKRAGFDCTHPSAEGRITVSTDITYNKGPYANADELPRIILMADCDIVISDVVGTVHASLIAGKSIMTCLKPARTDRECNTRLHINGLVQADSLKLWRTAGADTTNLSEAAQPAEDFNLAPDQILSSYSRGASRATPRQAYQIDLPPRY